MAPPASKAGSTAGATPHAMLDQAGSRARVRLRVTGIQVPGGSRGATGVNTIPRLTDVEEPWERGVGGEAEDRAKLGEIGV